MYYTKKELMDGNSQVVEYYKNARIMWEQIDISDINLREVLFSKQLDFEKACGGRGMGAEIMVWSGIMQYMNNDTPNIQSAKTIYNAFIDSNCNNEVKQAARDAAKEYGI